MANEVMLGQVYSTKKKKFDKVYKSGPKSCSLRKFRKKK